MKFSYACVVLALSIAGAAADETTKEKPPKPCTTRSPTSGAFFDLNSLYIHPPGKDSKSSKKDDKVESWHAKGYDYGANFTINFCGPVVEELDDVVGVSKSHWKDISAFYTVDKRTYSIGYATFVHLD
jgi:cation-dependent mannose-6-phosphate receptor